MNKIEQLLKEFRESSDRMYDIFTSGSCVRLFFILKIIFPKAQLYWSDLDNHAITKIGNNYYDIGGVVNKAYMKHKDYNFVSKDKYDGYRLLKKIEEGVSLSVVTEKYYK